VTDLANCEERTGNFRMGDDPPGTHKTVRNLSWKRASVCSGQPKIMTWVINAYQFLKSISAGA
jgi:hypothetical protein